MLLLAEDRKKAIALRKEGRTYTEILKDIHVAKSTLSGWLKDVSLASSQRHRITLKKLAAQASAVEAVKQRRRLLVQGFVESGLRDVGQLSDRDLFMLGTALYWAEGAKQKERFNVSQGVDFTNSNLLVIRVFLKWLKKCCLIDNFDKIGFELYIHESVGKARAGNEVIWWKRNLKLPENLVVKIRFKKHKLSTRRHILDYHGQFRVRVFKSTNLNRKIAGWIAGIADKF